MATYDPQKYARAKAFARGSEWLEWVDISIKRNSGRQTVKTGPKGWAGFQDGSGDMEISFSNMIPADGFEFDPDFFEPDDDGFVEITIVSGALQLTAKGYFADDSYEFGAEKLSSQSLTFVSGPASWK